MWKKFLMFLSLLYTLAAFAAVEVNTATEAELDGVKGIGPAISKRILDERKKSTFKDWADLKARVSGFGDKTSAKFSEAGLTVNGASFGDKAAPAKAEDKKASAPAVPASKVEDKKDKKHAAKAEDTKASAPVAPASKAEEKKDKKPATKAEDKKASAPVAPASKAEDKKDKKSAAKAEDTKASAPVAPASKAEDKKAADKTASADDALVKSKGCLACHAVDKKVVGPAYKDVAKKYAGDKKAADMLATKVIKGGSGTWGAVPMPPNNVTEAEAKKLVAWVLSQK